MQVKNNEWLDLDICLESHDVDKLRELEHLHPTMAGNRLQTAADCEAAIDAEDDPFEPLAAALRSTLGEGFRYMGLTVQSDGPAFLFCRIHANLADKALCLLDVFGLLHCVELNEPFDPAIS